MAIDKNRKTSRFINFGWFACILIALTLIAGGISYTNTKRIVDRAEQNNQELQELFGMLRDNSQYVVATDQVGRHYIDSINLVKTQKAQKAEEAIIKQATIQLTEYSGMLSRTADNTVMLLFVWAAVLALITLIFSFLGFMELKDRMKAVEDTLDKVTDKNEEIDHKKKDIDSKKLEIDAQKEQIDAKTQEIDDRKDEINAALGKVESTLSEF